MKEGSAGRRDQGNVLSQIAHSLKMDGAAIQAAARGYGLEVEKRDIPKDELIEEIWEKIKLPLAVVRHVRHYGLRPHEIVECRQIRRASATSGTRRRPASTSTWPVHRRWIKDFNLRKEHRPTQGVATVAKVANDYLHDGGVVPFPLYNLRHAYAIRLFHKGVPSDTGARVMGHGEEVHRETYKRWYDAKEIIGLADQYDL